MKKIKRVINELYTYESKEERLLHVSVMEKKGWECSSRLKEFTGSLMVDDTKDEKNYVWIGEFFKYE